MEYLLTHRTHPTVDDVYSGLCGRISTLSKTTVYNTLRMFAERQVATMITIDDHHVCYDGDIHPHVHFFCRNCGKVYDLMESDYVERELMLIKVRAIGRDRDEMLRITEIFRARVIDVTDKTYTIEVTGDSRKLDAFMKSIDEKLILETVRTGASGIARGERILKI